MAYCAASDVRLIIETSLSDTEIETLIEMSDAEIESRLGPQSPADKLVKKLCALITAHAIKTRQPQAISIGEYREETRGTLDAWEKEIERIYRLKGALVVESSGYEHIDEEKRYPEG